MRSGGRRRRCITIASVLACASLVGCAGGEGHAGSAALTDALVEREGLTSAQADCVVAYLSESYSPDAQAVLAEDGLGALPQVLWGHYAHALVSCTMADELGVPAPRPEAGP